MGLEKASGLGLLATFAISAIALIAMNDTTTVPALAKTGGHFVTDDTSGHTILTGAEKAANTPAH
jgi:hypothetical protein